MKIKYLFLVFAVLVFANLISAYTISNYDYSSGNVFTSSYYATGLSPEDCFGGSDFVVQIDPLKCEPLVVTSDLLEEEDVTVYCPIVATQVNPFIDVDAISYITITGKYSSDVRSVGYFPSESALGYWSDGSLDNLALNDLGYVAITLRQNANESSMPEYITGTLTAKLRYDIENSFGVGNAQYYLPVLSDEEFESNSAKYSFWDGRGYVRATSVGEDEATVSLYTNSLQKTGTIKLDKGETSSEMYINGLNPCLATLKVRLNSLENPDTRVKLKVNSDYIELSDEESFLDSACKVKSVTKNGINQEVKIYCKGDEKSGTYELIISPKVTLEVKGVTKDYELGDYLYDDGEKDVYLGYIGSKGDSIDEEDLFVVLVAKPLNFLNEERLSSSELSGIAEQMNLIFSDVDSGASVIDFIGNFGERLLGVTIQGGKWLVGGQEFQVVDFSSSVNFREGSVSIESFAVAQDAELFSLEEVIYSVTNKKILDSGEEIGLSLDYSLSGTPRILLKNSEDKTVGIFYGEDCETHDDCDFYSLSESGLIFEEGNYDGFFDNVVEGIFDSSINQFVLAKAVEGNSQSGSSKYYSNAMEDYQTLINSYASQTTDTDSETYGERGLYEAIYLSYSLGQMKTMLELCGEFETEYPDSNKLENVKGLCEDKYKTSNSELASFEIQINGDTKIISFEGVYEPSYQEYGAEVLIKTAKGETRSYELKKGKKVYLYGLSDSESESTNEYIELVSVDEDSARIKVNALKESTVSNLFETNTKTLNIDESDNFGSNYVFTLIDTNIEQNAKVTIIPSFNWQDSESEFNFSIGVEKRTILLSDEKIAQRIDFLNNTMKTLGNIVEGLDSFNRILGTTCLATGGYLTLKNLAANTDGSAIARNEIMTGQGGWTERCNQDVARGEYSSLENCFYANSDLIDADVINTQEIIEEQNNIIKNLQTVNSNNGVINKTKFTSAYSGEVSDSLTDVGTSITNSNDDEEISVSEVKELLSSTDAINQGIFDSQDLRDIQLYSELYSSAASGSDEKISYGDKLYSSLTDLMVNAKSFNLAQDLKEESGLENTFILNVGSTKKITEVTITEHNTFGESEYVDYSFATGSTAIGIDEYVAVVTSQGSTKSYVLVYSGKTINEGAVTATYLINTAGKTLTVEAEPNPLGLYFKKIKSEDLKNKYLNPEITYYESGAYDEYPSLVPLDNEEGWYVGIKDAEDGTAAYDVSGAVRIVWLCNVGSNGLEQFSLYSNDYGDDKCQQYKLNQNVVTFSGLTLTKTNSLLSKAQYSIEKIQRAYKNGVSSVTVDGVKYDVGEPASSTSEIQCENYMSPKDCRVLFNVCDPVVCPSSRCDFGGNYPVTDVVQTGVIGSILLCYPNAVWEGGTDYLPVCTTGVQAGLESWMNIEEAYRDCLQEYLDNGEITGACDKIHSIYACEFFWKQAIPLAEIGISKATSTLSGEGVRGGSEYLNFASALDNAKDSVDYFTQYYAAESYNAFKVRSAEEAGSAVCKVSASIVYSSGADLLDSLTTPRSPSQYTGSFTETVLTTTTNPPQSHYKVSYYIYAGEDTGATYQVYLKGSSGSYYQDSSSTYSVDSGYLPAGEYLVETPDFSAPSGYDTLCISVNGNAECGFDQSVSTSFAENYLTDLYLEEQASMTDITTEEECTSGTASYYSLINPNLQEIVKDLTETDLYADGITRVCATENPGKETDAGWNTEDAIWRDVGYCGDKNLRCWIDTDTIKEAIRTLDLEQSALNDSAQSYMEYLVESGNYISSTEFASAISEIKSESEPDEKISMINTIIDKVFYTNQKAELFLLRGQAYGVLAIQNFISEEKILVSDVEEESETDEEIIESDFSLELGESYSVSYNGEDFTLTLVDVASDSLSSILKVEEISEEKEFYIGDVRSFDLDGDSENDLQLILEDIENGESYFSYEIEISSECEDVSIGENILAIAETKVGQDTTRIEEGEEVYDRVCATFVSNVLIEAGVLPQFDSCSIETTPYRDAISELIDLFEENNYREISESNWKNNLQAGDIIVWGGSEGYDSEFQHITIFSNYEGTGVRIIHDGGAGSISDRREIESKVYPNPFGENWYITHIWRAGCENLIETEEPEESSEELNLNFGTNYVSPYLKLEDGTVTKDISYFYSEGLWYVSDDEENWFSSKGGNDFVDGMYEQGQLFLKKKNQDFILKLGEEDSYLYGLKLILKRLIEGGRDEFGGVLNPDLTSTDINLDHQGLIKVKNLEGIDNLYFKYSGGAWQWSFDNNVWIKSPLIEKKEIENYLIVPGGTVPASSAEKIVEESLNIPKDYQNLIVSLENLNFVSGIALIFHLVAEGNTLVDYCDYNIYEKEYNYLKEFLEDNDLNIGDVDCNSIYVESNSFVQFYLYNEKIDDLTNLGKLTNLRDLRLTNVGLEDASELNTLINLEVLYLNQNKIESLSFIENFDNLKTLELSENNLQDLNFFQDWPREGLLTQPVKIENLYIEKNCIPSNTNFNYLLDEGYTENIYFSGNPRADC